MTRRVTDGLIILAVLALASTHLWAQGVGGRRVVRPSQAGVSGAAGRGAGGATDGAAIGGRRVAGDAGTNRAADRTRAGRGPGDAPGVPAGRLTRPNAAAEVSGR
ncbi:hypothetical protein KF840_13575 [bacterium]|nr:hypothetical protein [bacterium]